MKVSGGGGRSEGSTRFFSAAQPNFRRGDELLEFPLHVSQFPLMTTHNFKLI